MGATFSRLKNWTTEILTNTDLNMEIDNILNNFGPAGVDDYSSTAVQMKLQTTPGGLGTESLATSLAGELERLRFVIQRLVGSSTSYWYQAPPSTITDLVAALGSGLPNYRIVSGKTTGNSSQLVALVPNGTTASLTLTASVTPFVYYVGGTQYSISANVTLAGLSLAVSSNNTCSVNETAAAAGQWTKFLGQYGTTIEVDAMDSNMATLVGQIAGFKTGAEYFIAYVNSTTALTNAWRGCFFNQTPSHIKPVALTNNDEIKLLKLAWIFANTNSSLAVTYTNPTVSGTQPTSPNTGDYWFDLSTTAWKTFNSTTWVDAAATLVGMSLQDTAACVAARTFDSYKAVSPLNTLMLETASTTVVQARGMFGTINVFGTANSYGVSRPTWNIATDLDSGLSESVSTLYYLYVKESGKTVISDIAPTHRRDLYGLYHPGELWRCAGSVSNNASTNFETPVRTFSDVPQPFLLVGDALAYNSVNSTGATGVAIFQRIPDTFPQHFVQANGTSITVWPFTSAQYGDIATLSLTQGVWAISALASVAVASATPIGTLWSIGISTVSGNSFTDGWNGYNLIENYLPSTTAHISTSSLPRCLFRVSATTNYFFKGFMNNATGSTVDLRAWRITAERLDATIGLPS